MKAVEVEFSSMEDTRETKSKSTGFATDTDISRGKQSLFGRRLQDVDQAWLSESRSAWRGSQRSL
jgi:hypothetical protein